MKKFLLLVSLMLIQFVHGGGSFDAIVAGNGELNAASGHIQGICVSDEALYFSHQKGIFKVDWSGKVIKHVNTENHTGDICYYNGRVYSAIACYDPKLQGRGAIQEFSSDLEALRRYDLPFPIDGITQMNGFFYFGVGPNPPQAHRGNRLGKIAADFSGEITFLKIDHGYDTRFGCQAITSYGDLLFISFYGAKTPMESAVFDKDGKLVKVLKFSASKGFAALPPRFKSEKPRFLKLVEIHNRRKKESPKVRVYFVEYDSGKMVDITRKK